MTKTTRSFGVLSSALWAFTLSAEVVIQSPVMQTDLATATPLSTVPTLRPRPLDLDQFDARKTTAMLPNGEELAYVDMGSRTGRPIVLIHAYTDNARSWVPMLPFMSPSDRLIVVDLRGHGKSAKPECCYAHIDFAYDIKLLLDHLHIDKVDVVGHSLGSFVAQVFAEQWPERTRRVVLISSTAGLANGRMPRASGPDFAAVIHRLKAPLSADSPFMIAWWKSPKPEDPDFFRREREDAAGIPLAVWWAMLDQGWTFDDLRRSLPRLSAPVLLIWGGDDFIMTPALRQSLRDALPAAKVAILPGLSHNPFWDDPAAVAKIINTFLASP